MQNVPSDLESAYKLYFFEYICNDVFGTNHASLICQAALLGSFIATNITNYIIIIIDITRSNCCVLMGQVLNGCKRRVYWVATRGEHILLLKNLCHAISMQQMMSELMQSTSICLLTSSAGKIAIFANLFRVIAICCGIHEHIRFVFLLYYT